MRQEARFLLAIALMILVLVTTNIMFPPIPPEEVSSTPPDSLAPLLEAPPGVGAGEVPAPWVATSSCRRR